MTATPQLWTKHRDVAYSISRRFYAPGMDRQDLEQEALVALWNACRTFDPEKGVPIKQWIRIVVLARMKDVVTAANRQKQRMLNEATPRGEELVSLVETCPDLAGSAEDQAITRMMVEDILGRVAALSPLQRRALLSVAAGLTYEEIGGDKKSIDNAVQGARRNLKR